MTPDAPITQSIDLDLLTQRLLDLLKQAEADQQTLNERIWALRGQLELVTQLRGQLTQPEVPNAPNPTDSASEPAPAAQPTPNPRRRRNR